MSADAAMENSRRTPALGALFAPAERVLPHLLTVQAARHGDKTLLVTADVTWRFSDAPTIAARAGSALTAAGVQPGDRVAILCGNRAEPLEIFLGCAWIGAIAVPINTASVGAQLQHILTNSGARLIVIEDALFPSLATAGSGLPLTEAWVIGDGAPSSVAGLHVRAYPRDGGSAAPYAARPGDLLTILYTSGTTGFSKGVCCPHAHCFWWGANSADLMGVTEGDVLLTSLPLFHINALNTFYQALLCGATLALERRFSASRFSQQLVERGATITYLLGAMVPMLLAQPPRPADRAHNVRVALGPAVPEPYHAQFRERFGISLVDGYGSTETNFVIGDPASERSPGFMGRLRPGFSARVVDEDDNPVADGTPGELVLRADEPFAFASGYFGMSDKAVEAWRNLWFHTGDRVVRDPAGRYRFVDRLKDVIRRRGENISAYEVEIALAAYPAVADVAVFAVPSDLAEEEVMAAVVLRPDTSASPEDLLEHCQSRIPYFAVPRFIEFIDALPLTENGKVQKFKLRERGITAQTWDRQAGETKSGRR